MPRVKSGVLAVKARRKLRSFTKGFVMGRRTLYRRSLETLKRSFVFAFRDRKVKKRNFRQLWISRINAAVRSQGMNYSRFVNGMKKANITINRKMLSNIAITDPKAFSAIVEQAKAAQKK